MSKLNNDAHEEFNEDMQWANSLQTFKRKLTAIDGSLRSLEAGNPHFELAEMIGRIRIKLTTQVSNLEEIAHIARSHEFTLLLKLQVNSSSAQTFREASRAKEQNLMKCFEHHFSRFSEEYDSLIKMNSSGSRKSPHEL